jgi:hypothetical protein
MRRTVSLLLVGALIVSSRAAVAQTLSQTPKPAAASTSTWEDRAYLNIGAGFQSGSADLTDTKAFTIYEEAASITSASSFSSKALADVSVGVKVWRSLSLGVGLHQQFKNTADATISGTVPHPVFFNQARRLTSTASLERTESAVHVVLGWTRPISDKLDVTIFGGPSFFRLQQDVVADTKVVEAAPFTQVTVQPTIVTRKKSTTGYNAGADVAYLFWQNDSVRVGVGAFVRYASAKADILMLTKEQETTIGGPQYGFGLRFRF